MPSEVLPSLRAERTDPLAGALAALWRSLSPRNGEEAAVVADEIRLSRGSSAITDAVVPAAAALVAYACRAWVPAWLLIGWVVAVALACAATNLIGRRVDRDLGGGAAAVARVARIRTAMTTAMLALWCAQGILFWVPNNPLNHMLLVLVLACSLAGAVSIVSAHPATAAGALAVHGAVLVLRPALSGSSLDLTLAGLSALFLVLIATQARVIYGMASQARTLERERYEITRELVEAKFESDRERNKAQDAGRAKTRFLSNMNHELRTPMNAILGFSELIKLRAFGSQVDKYAEYGAMIHDAGGHLLALIEDMMELARIEGGRLTLEESRFSLAELIREVADDYRGQADAAELALSTSIEIGLPDIRADRRAIHTVLVNLVSNAVKFTGAGGRVCVAAACMADGRLELAVEDDGIGIAPDEQQQVFERFGQARHDVSQACRGTGLGLSIVKGFAEAHDGSVELTSAPGIGTRVSVRLPAARVMAPAAAARRAHT